MSVPRFAGVVAFTAMVFVPIGINLTVPVAASEVRPHVRTVCYDASQAGPFSNAVHQAAAIWNDATRNVHLAPCGSDVMIYYAYDGGSYAVPLGLGKGYVVVDHGEGRRYGPVRILVHELGHILGLPDNHTRGCRYVMYRNFGCADFPYPNLIESVQVDYTFTAASE